MTELDRRRIAQALSTVENRSDVSQALLRQAYASTGPTRVVGVTGPPGAGKSTLVDCLCGHWAGAGGPVAVMAIDPSSPFSGGALLGDRIRQSRAAGMANVFFRSLSSRGHVGGLSETAADMAAVLKLFGFSHVLVETVGAGQADTEIQELADCTLVVTVPGLGDAVQAAKAGLMEIADIFAVNKADLPGAEDVARTVERAVAAAYMGEPGVNVCGAGRPENGRSHPNRGLSALARRHGDPAVERETWTPPVLRVSAAAGDGIEALAAAADLFLDWAERSGRRELRQQERTRRQIMRLLSALLMEPFLVPPGRGDDRSATIDGWTEEVRAGRASPLDAARALAGERRIGRP